jgi:glycosyltransferase involved in cell wall biosynthesis
MSGLPLISIIIPCYNYGKFLEHTLSELLNQECTSWECIVVDDGSTDNTREVAITYTRTDGRIQYVHQANAGLSAARNTGIRYAKGKYIQLLDADDLIDPRKLAIQAGFLEQHRNIDVVFGDSVFFKTEDEGNPRSGQRNFNNTGYLKTGGCGTELTKNLCINNFIEVSAPLIRKTVFERVGDFDISYFTYEDWQFWFRCAFNGICLAYEPVEGTETYIRYGHASMLGNIKKKVQYGIKVRTFIMGHLPLKLKLYNSYRLGKLVIRKMLAK